MAVFQDAVDATFAAFGIDATYTPAAGSRVANSRAELTVPVVRSVHAAGNPFTDPIQQQHPEQTAGRIWPASPRRSPMRPGSFLPSGRSNTGPATPVSAW
jgi:hypothetical protein